MKINAKLILSLLVLIIPLVNCTKKYKELGSLSFSSQNFKTIPYTGHEIITCNLYNNWFDTLQVSGKVDDFYKITENSSSVFDDHYNGGDYFTIEFFKITFTTKLLSQSAIRIYFRLLFDNPFQAKTELKYLTVAIGATYDEGGAFINNFQIDNDSIIVDNYNVFFHKSLSIGTKQFNSVYELHGSHTWPNYIDIIYYTLDSGIVATKDYNGYIGYFNKLN